MQIGAHWCNLLGYPTPAVGAHGCISVHLLVQIGASWCLVGADWLYMGCMWVHSGADWCILVHSGCIWVHLGADWCTLVQLVGYPTPAVGAHGCISVHLLVADWCMVVPFYLMEIILLIIKYILKVTFNIRGVWRR